MNLRKIPSLLKLRNCFEEKTFQELFQLQFKSNLLDLLEFEFVPPNLESQAKPMQLLLDAYKKV